MRGGAFGLDGQHLGHHQPRAGAASKSLWKAGQVPGIFLLPLWDLFVREDYFQAICPPKPFGCSAARAFLFVSLALLRDELGRVFACPASRKLSFLREPTSSLSLGKAVESV